MPWPSGLSGTPARIERPAPGLGEQTREVLQEIGYAEADVEVLLQDRCVLEPETTPGTTSTPPKQG